ncbi:hypothetical protein BN8_01608 [Fibrisoma limi BUZ 3]|uniref:Co-chaperone DjlA N-terminal domain-containing protein n=1 Tax=Fibrisoma limi BUZ 3 TaxID=1185876 RepID=I2GFC1_9BACT|nr:hypothetical protein [Fibrisoma limi]CCH52596.1 hypothetical protein BN8_01608 [Fibrisoma limi BUZ 3]
MYSPDISMGMGSIVYALSKLDGCLQPEEIKTVNQLLAGEPYSDLARYAFFLRENTGETVEEAYAFGMRRLRFNGKELNQALKKQFVNVLIRVAQSTDGISAKEQAFIQQFRREIRRL